MVKRYKWSDDEKLNVLVVNARPCWPIYNSYKIVYVGNWLPGNATLDVQCYSKHDDVGFKILRKGQEFTFNFCESIFFDTKFYCQTQYWSDELKGPRKLNFVAFNTLWKHHWCRPHGVCYWALSAEGIFFSPTYPPQQFQKFDGWS
ncbi:S-protein homolog 8-like [Henckelia pumila]|uniref:S-protein homolog 8-like n=1 Tax=Henckelia pumila TaxID=405737 RepID=UPI003C6E3CCB